MGPNCCHIGREEARLRVPTNTYVSRCAELGCQHYTHLSSNSHMLRRATSFKQIKVPMLSTSGTRHILGQMQGGPHFLCCHEFLHCELWVDLGVHGHASACPLLHAYNCTCKFSCFHVWPRCVLAGCHLTKIVTSCPSGCNGTCCEPLVVNGLRTQWVSNPWRAAIDLCAWFATSPSVATVTCGPIDVVACEAHP